MDAKAPTTLLNNYTLVPFKVAKVYALPSFKRKALYWVGLEDPHFFKKQLHLSQKNFHGKCSTYSGIALVANPIFSRKIAEGALNAQSVSILNGETPVDIAVLWIWWIFLAGIICLKIWMQNHDICETSAKINNLNSIIVHRK
ncbi:hypothetical protein EGR_02237 [Echinococcus granulosus]|uniref:Uncharacterized protein n=1 Tax=Echinococcus granulosus TaxID=6210 RepID=W6UPT6_ECHGR|nr:hypothetical protein EGR_02237 [Echinococcus granulosus]EUB62796.1 hypothetical protein EGR_02237 [Echinococcus granulosus]